MNSSKDWKKCLEACGESTSSLKDTATSIVANLQAMGHAMARDEILKNAFADNAFENYEIAAHKYCSSSGLRSRSQASSSTRSNGGAIQPRMANLLGNHAPDIAAMDLFVVPTIGTLCPSSSSGSTAETSSGLTSQQIRRQDRLHFNGSISLGWGSALPHP
jgi:hypothetical protein